MKTEINIIILLIINFTISKDNIYRNNDRHNFIDLRDALSNESNYIIINPYLSYEYQLNKSNSVYPIVIGNFEYNDTFYFELEIEFQEDYKNDENNINNISINVQLNNKDVNDYLDFVLQNLGVSLIKKFGTGNKYYYLYSSNDKFTSGVKSLFFYINHKGQSPNCFFKFGTFKEDPIKYENNLILLNQEKNFTNIFDIFFLSLNLTKVSFLSNDNINFIFKANKNAFKSDIIYYSYSDSNAFNYNINGTYSICNSKIEEQNEEIIIKCLISKKSTNPLHFILYLNQNYEINVQTEIIYKSNFDKEQSCTENKKYILSNNATASNNYYIFISSNFNFNITDISYNFIDNLDDFSESFPFLETKEAKTSNDKRIYVNIKNVENKKLIGFKTNKIIIPFKIINTKFDESNTIFIYDDIETNKFMVKENEPLLFVLKIKENNNKLYSKFTSDIKINYFNSLKYYGTTNKFQSFSYYQKMNNLTENAYKIFIANNKTVVFKEISKSNYDDNYFGFLINQTIAGQIKFELLSSINEFSVGLNDDIPYNLKNGINYVTTNLNGYNGYFYILKHPNSEGTDMIDICASNGDFSKSQINMYNCDTDIKKDDSYTYYFSNFYSRTNLIIFSKISSDITIRQSNRIETDILKIRNFNENVVQVKNTNKIVLISDINIDKGDNIYYFKFTIEKKFKDKVYTQYYLENKDIDNILDFFERNKNNIRVTTALNYEDKIDYHLETDIIFFIILYLLL